MKAIALRLRLQSDSGFSLVELVVTCAVMGIIIGSMATIFVAGERANADATARMTSQQGVRTAFDKLEYDARCASSATLLNKTGSNGAGVYLTLPGQCDHATGNVTWCVSSGALIRNTGTTCAATTNKITYIAGVTSATPFSCYSPAAGAVPQVQVALTVNPATRNADKTAATDYITLHNDPQTYNTNTTAATLPAATITVASTSGFSNAGTLGTVTNGTITYTGTTSTTFTGATGGTGSLVTNSTLVANGCS
ncbi:MAG TPA: type II secretion system protein [Gaiellaceae bacterium]|jgi:prepilin-type N-terminal cleavage/methylation domain-containing protein